MTSVDGPLPYDSPRALESALNARLKKASAESPFTVGQLRRQFAYDRLLSRLMLPSADGTPARWMIKGGVGLLARLTHARHTTDVDLRAAQADPQAALEALVADACRDLGDFFTFKVGQPSALVQGTPGLQLPVEAVLGRKSFERFHVDLVVGPLPIGEPETVAPLSPVTLPGLTQARYQLYPLADTLADKTLAIVQRYGSNAAPSSRYRDLVDIVLISTERSVDLQELSTAVALQRTRRGVPEFASFEVPDGRWVEGYRITAAGVPGLASYRDLTSARELAKALLDPVLGGEVTVGRWDPRALAWEPYSDVDSSLLMDTESGEASTNHPERGVDIEIE